MLEPKRIALEVADRVLEIDGAFLIDPRALFLSIDCKSPRMSELVTFTVPFATWMMIGYFRNVPSELEDAALIDGCSRIQALVRIMVPIALPALAVVALFAFTLSWNEFLYALVFIGSDSQKTLTLGLIGLVRGDTFPWGPMMAASLLGTLPPTIVYLFSQRWVVAGLAAGSVKG